MPTGSWTVVVRRLESVVLAPIWSQFVFRLAVVVVGLAVVMALFVMMTVRLARRVNVAVDAAERVAAGELRQSEFARRFSLLRRSLFG